MQKTSDLYKALFAEYQEGRGNVHCETRLAIGDTGRLITEKGECIVLGGVRIRIGQTGADCGYGESFFEQGGIKTISRVFSQEVPEIGSCVSSEITVKMKKPTGRIPRQAKLSPYVRLTDGVRASEWLRKGVYFIDTRGESGAAGSPHIELHGFDAMLRAEEYYPDSSLAWPANDIEVVQEIAAAMGISVDPRTASMMTAGYKIEYPAEYSQREVLGYIAAMYAGSFCISDNGELMLVCLAGLPKPTRYLVDENRRPIVIGGVRILV